MRKRTHFETWLVIVMAVLLWGSCSSTSPPERTGFLDRSLVLTEVPGSDSMAVWVSSEGVLAGYSKFMIDPVVVYFGEEAGGKGLDPQELTQLTEKFREAVVAELERGDYEVVDVAGPEVLQVRAALTDVVPVNPLKNVAAKAAGAATGVGLLIPSLDVGGASIEVEMLDSASGETVVALIDRKAGRRYLSGLNSVTRWGDVESAFNSWAKEFRERLDQVRD